MHTTQAPRGDRQIIISRGPRRTVIHFARNATFSTPPVKISAARRGRRRVRHAIVTRTPQQVSLETVRALAGHAREFSAPRGPRHVRCRANNAKKPSHNMKKTKIYHSKAPNDLWHFSLTTASLAPQRPMMHLPTYNYTSLRFQISYPVPWRRTRRPSGCMGCHPHSKLVFWTFKMPPRAQFCAEWHN